MAALLAQQGFVATREFLTAPDGGLYSTYTNGGRPEDATSGLGQRWELERIALRPWPSASTIQGMITAMFDLTEKHRLAPEKIEKVRVSMGKAAMDLHGIFPRYKGKFEALLSTHYAAAVILHDRALTLAQFEPARYEDPELRRFAAERVEMSVDSSLAGAQAVVEAQLTDGTSVATRCDHPRGSYENPLTPEEVAGKLRTYAKGRLTEARIEEAIATVSRLEELKSARRLMEILRTGRQDALSTAA
jgi:2-methylcitrate dehydratase PrpD